MNEAKEEILNENEKLMIFTTGTRTYQAHQVGIKLMSKVKFRTKLNIPENIFEAAQEAKRKKEEERAERAGRINFEPTPWSDYRQVAQMFDVVDVLIDFHGYVTGYGVSPDSRFSKTAKQQIFVSFCSYLHHVKTVVEPWCNRSANPIFKNPFCRYLYVNVRPWPKDFEITDPWIAPPCGLVTEVFLSDPGPIIVYPCH